MNSTCSIKTYNFWKSNLVKHREKQLFIKHCLMFQILSRVFKFTPLF